MLICTFILGGSIWRPPPIHPYTQGMPEELIEEEVDSRTKGSLSATQRDRLEDLLRGMVPDKLKIAEVMVFCIEHADAAEEICDCIAESLSNVSTALHKKVRQIYYKDIFCKGMISDVCKMAQL